MEVKKYPIRIKTLSPIFIGSGNTFDALEYYNSPNPINVNKKPKKQLKRINFDKFFLSLNDDEKDRILSNVSDDSRYILEQDFPKINSEFYRYTIINECPESKDKFKSVISEHIKTMDEVYIPGSSIKGAIKTALFYNIVPDRDIEKIQNILSFNKYNKRYKINNFKYNNFIDYYFSTKKGNSAQKNIMRFLHVSDSSTEKYPRLYEILTIMAESKFNQPNGIKLYRNNKNPSKSYFETIAPKRGLDTELVINYDKDILEELEFSNKQKQILDIDFIKNCIYTFSKDLINYEIDFFNKYDQYHKMNELNEIVNNLIDFYERISKYNSKKNPLLRIGAGSGLMATSIAMKVKQYDRNNGTDIFDQIMGTFYKKYPYEFPKSRKILSNNENLPLSWVQLNFK
ncbi:type III-A CRISPR-associated RAMP protein Csm5 [uncultured Methanobrevibacter sp.]|uniref:type III-A CRISPR-associated RAMP protein Csm5 n=1 Tax=uncultured Methanobrevibacter sp. TaxID=253161 RepID=UPI002637DDB1|nr:type III-A CRISPR-associated RAMP protein Csm5 [uncultured Methanobrevibacter sp.]